jgi:methyl-accepting chemotaxis protein
MYMRTHWTIGKKLAVSFVCVAAITLFLGIVGYYGAVKGESSIQELGSVRLPAVENLLTIKNSAERIRGTIRTLIVAGLPIDIRQRQSNNIVLAQKDGDSAWKVIEQLPQTTEEADIWNQFSSAWKAWQEENGKLSELFKQFDRNGVVDPTKLTRDLEQFTKDHYILVQRILHLLHMKDTAFSGGDDHTGCNAGKWLPTFKTDNEALKNEVLAIVEPHRHFHESVGKIKRLVAEAKREEAEDLYQREMVPAMETVFKHFDAMLAVGNNSLGLEQKAKDLALGNATTKMLTAIDLLNKLVQIHRNVAAEDVKESLSQASFLKMSSVVSVVLGVIAAVTLGFFVTRSINGALRRIISGLNEGAGEVASAAGQVSGAAQSLAEGSSEQAASIEETSSSLEEMSSMTKRNADNAGEANNLMIDAKEVVATANQSMGRLTESMGEITKASEETSKIIKTIDEIAFQTNLLALNAAVEAARAGEAGAGFAVVADEVRNLAMRAAEAAKNTANLIEGTVKKVKDGSNLVSRTNEAFHQVAGSSAKAADLVAEIAAASKEQAQGIDQINTAVTELDKVTQQNAANAEESASAAEEMSAQAKTMQGIVGELVAMVGGAGKPDTAGRTKTEAKTAKAKHALSAGVRKAMGKVGIPKRDAKPAEKAIPLDENELVEF